MALSQWWTARSCGHTSTRPGPEKGAEPNYKNPRVEPADHGLGHSRGGWSTKSHVAVDPSGHLRSVVVTPGQAGENPRLLDVLDTTGARGLTLDLGHVESSRCWRKRDDQDHGQEELLR